jgi:hypothetical protein
MLRASKDKVNVKDRKGESVLEGNVMAGKRLAGDVNIFPTVNF